MHRPSIKFPLNLHLSYEARAEIYLSTFVLICAICLIVIFPSAWTYSLGVIVGLLWVIILRFFRDPDRHIPSDIKAYLSPADGKVVVIDTIEEPLFMKGKSRRVAIFMSLSDVHVNRCPIDGEVGFRFHKPGKFLQAFREEASEYNEHHLTGITGEGTRVLVKQIAGIMARRIKCRLQPGDRVSAGERLGIIKLGSRVEIFMPLHSKVMVSIGDQVKAGETIIAHPAAEK